jgi:hypothetical protein
MLAKLTVKNQLTLPKAVAKQFAGIEYFEVSTDGAVITLKPHKNNSVEEIWAHLERLGITDQDIDDAVKWARSQE